MGKKNILTVELLLKSVEKWNATRRAHPDLKPNLSGADLSVADLRWADLHEANLSSVNLVGVTLSRANLNGANLHKAHLNNAHLSDVQLNNADLTEAILCRAYLSRACLKDAQLVKADFSEAQLDGTYLSRADLSSAQLCRTNLYEANLSEANLSFANLYGANLSSADFCKADLILADLRKAHLYGTKLTGANLSHSNLNGSFLSVVKLAGANISSAKVGDTTFGAVDLSSVIGLDTVEHKAPSTIGIDTIYASKGNIPEVFLRGCGVLDNFIEYVHSLTVKAFDFYSCFISYSTKDDDFARRIHNDLQASGVRCWFAPHDIQGGKKVLHQIEEAIRLYDKLLLILSPDSMNSNWVEQEIINAIQKEQQQQKQVLFPISIVPFDEIKKWKRFDSDSGRDLAREIREYHIPDFSRWGSDQAAYKTAFDRLLKDLKQ